MSTVLRLSKKASQNFLRMQKTKSKSFCAGACTWHKILLRLQVWNLFAYSEQIMRAADCKTVENPLKGVFDKLRAGNFPGSKLVKKKNL